MYYRVGLGRLNVRLNGLIREMLWCLSLPGIVYVSEFPKCGGTWLSQLLSGLSGKPFHRNKIPYLGSQVLLGHRKVNKNAMVVTLIRNPFDVCLSFYNYVNNVERDEVRLIRSRIIDIYGKVSIDAVIDYLFVRGLPRIGTYQAFYENLNQDLIKYEDLRVNTTLTLSLLSEKYSFNVSESQMKSVIEQFSINNARRKDPKFVQHGIIKGYKEYLSESQIDLIKIYCSNIISKVYSNDIF